MSIDDEIKILTVKDLMRCLHIGKEKAYCLMRSKNFPSTQIGKTYFITQDNLKKWLDENAGERLKM